MSKMFDDFDLDIQKVSVANGTPEPRITFVTPILSCTCDRSCDWSTCNRETQQGQNGCDSMFNACVTPRNA